MIALVNFRRIIFLYGLILWNTNDVRGKDVSCYDLHRDWCIIFDPIADEDVVNITLKLPLQFETVTGFTLGGKSSASQIPTVFFEKFPSAEEAHIFTGGVSTLKKTDFTFAKSLSNLELKSNIIRSIPKEVFTEATNLNRVDLEANQISEIEDYAFSGSNKLTFVILRNNLLTKIGKYTFAGVPDLNNIWLSGNQIDTIEEGAFDLPKLKLLFLSENKLKHLSPTIFAHSPLMEVADVASNQLTRIGDTFYNLPELTLLHLQNNHLEDLDLTKFENPKLSWLDLSNTSIQLPLTPPDVGDKSLTVQNLFLDNNNLSQPNIFDYLKIFKGLRWLHISNNQFTHFDNLETITHDFTDLQRVTVHDNHFSCKWVSEQKTFASKIFLLKEFNSFTTVDKLPCE